VYLGAKMRYINTLDPPMQNSRQIYAYDRQAKHWKVKRKERAQVQNLCQTGSHICKSGVV